ncbi:hypothetical protein E3N88_45010 [Mikania micrantha]|uniref:RING-type domain-containing protein n=1 Tax=Mikania micrantha TaxID=192012 RepID=A0A5N6LAE0_9ASTR|nr:hypothetical protein E3N88_45010 [Mikania micrantha]
MVDVIVHLCKEENLLNPLDALQSNVLDVVPKVKGIIRHLESNSSLLEAIDCILEGAQNLVIPICTNSRKQPTNPCVFNNTLHHNQQFCWLTQEDVVRFLLNSIDEEFGSAKSGCVGRSYPGRRFEAIVCHPWNSLIAVMVQMIALRVSYAWVVKHDYTLVGIVTYADILNQFRSIEEIYVGSMRRSFKDSLKVLEADIQHANALALDLRREYDGACVQMRMSYSAAARFLLFFCSMVRLSPGRCSWISEDPNLQGIIYPSLMQLQRGATHPEDSKQKKICDEGYLKQDDDDDDHDDDEDDDAVESRCSDIESEEECGICMEANDKLVLLPKCTHAMCSNCYNNWRRRSLSCPFCRVSLKTTDPGEVWVYVCRKEVMDIATIRWGNLKRFFMYIENLPLV